MSVLRRAIVLATVSLLVAGCANSPANKGEDVVEDGETHTVATERGKVDVPNTPQRVMVLNSALAGYFYALDVPVRAAVPLNTEARSFPEFWADEARADKTTRLPWSDDGFNLEAILAEKPDLIVAGGQGFPGKLASDVYDKLSEIAPTVMVSSKLRTWREELDFIANDLLNSPEKGKELVQDYKDRVAEVREAIDAPPAPVGYLLMGSDNVPWSIPERASLPATLAEVGLSPQPILKENPDVETFGSGDSFKMSTERVGQFITAPTVFVLGFQDDVTSVAELSKQRVYSRLPAFAADRAYDLPYWAHRADYYATMALLDRVEKLFG